MRTDALLKLLATERSKRAVAPKTSTPQQKLSFLLFMGISDIDIATIIVPKIVDLETSGEFSKETVKKFIQFNTQITVHPSPVRHLLDNSIRQRRMDSLSRLLSPNNKYTPCVAVVFYKGALIVSSNSPKEEMTDAMLADCFSQKIGLIQDFIHQLIKNIPMGSQPHVKKIHFSKRTKLLAIDTVLKIIEEKNGGVGDVVPATKENRHKKRQGNVEHLQNALLKLGKYCLLSVYTNGKKGFTVQELSSLLSSAMTIVTPNTEALKEKQLHAEQAILYYLNEYTDFNKDPLAEKVNIGISKLTCQACHNVLNRVDKVSHRGSHGVKFPQVYDIDTAELFPATNTKLGTDLCATDSASEYETFSDDEAEPVEDIPAVESLLSEKEAATDQRRYRLFKPFKLQETENELSLDQYTFI
jgi:G:T/U-mismatch repair DNA glycosylase